MKSSNIGGQAVMEGIMMKNEDEYAVAVRKTDGSIIVKKDTCRSVGRGFAALMKIPFIRGVFHFIDSMALGMQTLMYSASFFEEEEEKKENRREKKEGHGEALEGGLRQSADAEGTVRQGGIREKVAQQKKREKKKEELLMAGTVVLSVVLAVGIFMALPYFLSSLLERWVPSYYVRTVIEGLIRIGIFIAYILLISKMEDIQRLFGYHGAEHKCINCIEHGLPLNVENVRKSSRQHKRCGTSFLFFVLIISIFLLCVVRAESPFLRAAVRILLLPVIAGISYEILKLAGRSENFLVNLLSWPGLAIQRLTTREPDDAMIEVAIRAVEAVFDWKAFEKENFESADAKG